MEFRILGPLEVIEDGRPIPLDRRLSRALLAYLLLHANEAVSAERLVDQLWGETPPKTATASLQNYVSRLRKAIGPGRLRLVSGGYVLHVDPELFDLARFDRLVSEAAGAPAKQRSELLRAAIGLWRGEPLEDLALEEFAQSEIAQLSERLLNAVENRIDAELELGRGAELVGELEGLISAHPLRERLRAHLMLALYRAGRQADALDAYREARRMLRDELGLEPSEELRTLERRLLEQDPALGASAAERTVSESRRTVTVLFCDIVGSTRFATSLDPEAYGRLLSSYYQAAKSAIEAHGGTVEKFIGDAVMALFGVPELHEDDPLRAVRAAVDVRTAIEHLNVERTIQVRIAVNTGEVVTSPDGGATGAAVNIAAHLEKWAPANAIVLGEQTYALVRDSARAEAVDLGEGLHGHRLEELLEAPETIAGSFDAPLVGRKRELRKVRNAFQRARKDESCAVVTVVGEAGIGKTRLAHEFVASVRGEAQVLVGRCVSYGAGATYLPIAEVVRQAVPDPSVAAIASLLAGEDDAEQVAQRVAEVIGIAEGPAAPGESFWAVRRLLEVLSRYRPLVVVFDDVHWAEPTLLDLVEYLGGWAEAPILVLCLARRELLEARAGWGGPRSTGFVVELEPLGNEDINTFLEELAGGPVAPDVRERIVEHAGGNPLFAEQLLALASEAPDVSLDKTPATVEGLIASRLDRLDPRELELLRDASVIGRLFFRVDLEDLTPFDDADLRSLERRALLHPMLEDDRFRFHHVLVRDVAYRGIPKSGRAELHERVANNLDRRGGPDEIIGYHLEQAYGYRVELAKPDEHAHDLATGAADHLGPAGIRAWKRADAAAAVNLLGRASALVPSTPEQHIEGLYELAVALWATGEMNRAQETFSDAVRQAGAVGDQCLLLRARIEEAFFELFRNPEGKSDDLLELASGAISEFESHGDHRSLARTWRYISYIRGGLRCQYAKAEEAAERSLAHSRKSGWPSSIEQLAGALYYGPTRVSEALARCEPFLSESQFVGAQALMYIAGLTAMQGDFATARMYFDESEQRFDELGMFVYAKSSVLSFRAEAEAHVGEYEAAAKAFRASNEQLERLGNRVHIATQAGETAHVLISLNRLDEAEESTNIAAENAASDDLSAEMQWRSARARLFARAGDSRAEPLAREAVRLAERTDALSKHGHVLLHLAEVLTEEGRPDDAVPYIKKAQRLFQRKEDLASYREAKKRLSLLVAA